jgi:hypothetical protein
VFAVCVYELCLWIVYGWIYLCMERYMLVYVGVGHRLYVWRASSCMYGLQVMDYMYGHRALILREAQFNNC